jgi:hypothetical protein
MNLLRCGVGRTHAQVTARRLRHATTDARKAVREASMSIVSRPTHLSDAATAGSHARVDLWIERGCAATHDRTAA